MPASFERMHTMHKGYIRCKGEKENREYTVLVDKTYKSVLIVAKDMPDFGVLQRTVHGAGLDVNCLLKQDPYFYYQTPCSGSGSGDFYQEPNALYVIKIDDMDKFRCLKDVEIDDMGKLRRLKDLEIDDKSEGDYYVSSMSAYIERKNAHTSSAHTQREETLMRAYNTVFQPLQLEGGQSEPRPGPRAKSQNKCIIS